MSQLPPEEANNNQNESANPDVPPEYLGNPAASDPSPLTWLPETPPPAPPADVPPEYLSESGPVYPPASQQPLPPADVPPEYLSGSAAAYPAASEQHPQPSTDVPREYLDPLPPPIHPDPTPLPPVSNFPPGAAVYPPQPGAGAYPPAVHGLKDRSIAILLEVLPGLFGFLGIGWLYAGNIPVGLAVLIGYWVVVGIEAIVIGFLAAITFGLACCCALPLNIIAVTASALLLNNYADQHPEIFSK